MGLWGYPESPIRGASLDDGETVDRPKSANFYESLSTVNPTVRITDTNASIDGLIETFDDLKEVIAGQELISNFKLVLDYCRKTVEVRRCSII